MVRNYFISSSLYGDLPSLPPPPESLLLRIYLFSSMFPFKSSKYWFVYSSSLLTLIVKSLFFLKTTVSTYYFSSFNLASKSV